MTIVIDADFSMGISASHAIELGVRAALREQDYTAGGVQLDVVARDHRANTKRSRRTMEEFLEDPRALAVIGGSHSPPYLSHRRFINESGILLLLPWSAAGPITRAEPDVTNWIFRLSVDDSKAGAFLVRRALDGHRCKRPVLLLQNTGWGRVNRDSMLETFLDLDYDLPDVIMFSTSLGPARAEAIADEIKTRVRDCVILLSGNTEGVHLTRALHAASPFIDLISHWGIMTGDYFDQVPNQMLRDLNLEVLQTCGLRSERNGRTVLSKALSAADDGSLGVSRLADMRASAGFVHGYDITRLLLAAIQQVSETASWAEGDAAARRDAVRRALEDLSDPVEGILKTYYKPFGPYSVDAPDTHEALGGQDLCLISVDDAGRFIPADQAGFSDR